MEDILHLDPQLQILQLSLEITELKRQVENKNNMLDMLQKNILNDSNKPRKKIYTKKCITIAKRLYYNKVKDKEETLKNLNILGYDNRLHESRIIKQFTDLTFNLLPNNLKEEYIKEATCLD